MNAEALTKYADEVAERVISYAPKVALALLFFIVGFWLAGRVGDALGKAIKRRRIDETLAPFLVNLATWGLRAMVLISVASMVGIETTSFVAVLGAAGLAVGLALQGSLANFAGGVLILLFRPYRVGDVIEAQGQVGVVQEIQIFSTVLLSGQRRRIIIPNGPMSNGTIINYTVEEIARVDHVIGVSYDCDIEEARRILMQVLKDDERVLEEPEPSVEVLELADNSVNFAVRPFVKTADYWPVHFATLAEIKKRLDGAGIEIPFPQRTVHLRQAGTLPATPG